MQVFVWSRYHRQLIGSGIGLPLHRIFLSTLVQVGEFEAKLFTGEVSVMQVISHPCIVQLLGVCTRELPFLLVMEYMPKGNLLMYLRGTYGKNLKAMTLVYMAQQVASAMEYLESMAIVHRYVCTSGI